MVDIYIEQMEIGYNFELTNRFNQDPIKNTGTTLQWGLFVPLSMNLLKHSELRRWWFHFINNLRNTQQQIEFQLRHLIKMPLIPVPWSRPNQNSTAHQFLYGIFNYFTNILLPEFFLPLALLRLLIV